MRQAWQSLRAPLVRAVGDRGLAEVDRNLEHELAAIAQSFGVLTADDMVPERGAEDERQSHLEEIWGS